MIRISTQNGVSKVSKDEKIRNRYNQVQHLTQDTNGKKTNLQLDTTNERQEVSPFPAGYHKAHVNRRKKDIANTRQNKNMKDQQKKYRLGTVSFTAQTSPLIPMWIKTHRYLV